MSAIRILVVDDVAIIRRLVVDALSNDPELQVVGTARNGRDALAKISTTRPDLIVLDYEMPEMDGLETLIEVRKSYPGVRVIIFSSHTRQGAKETLDALWYGADDYVTKAKADSPAAATECVRSDLVPKIKAICAKGAADAAAAARSAASAPAPPRDGPRPRATSQRVDVVAIGASTGGPKALAVLIEGLPRDFQPPVVIVQHMPPVFTRYLAERLATRTSLRCAEGATGATLEPGTVWIAPGDHHMIVNRDGAEVRIQLTSDPLESGCRPAVDPLFRSVAQAYGAGALGVMLTGMGQDGLQGCREIRRAMGQILIQDEASSVVWGMPGAVHRAGIADRVLPLEEIAGEIEQRVLLGNRRRSPVG
jgi:two-component system chemotaxis response regulator CheB